MNTTINIENITTNIETGITTITLIEDVSPVTTIVEESVDIALVELGFQGPPGSKGDKGENLNYNNLTLEEKNEIISQYDNILGNTSYTNIFLNTLLS